MPIRPTHRASVLLHASWAIAQAHSLDWPWRDGASWAGGHSDDRSAIANVVLLEQPMLDMDQGICEVDDLFLVACRFCS